MIIIGNGRLITRDREAPYFENGAVVVKGERIEAVGPLDELTARYPEAQFIDARGGLIHPGLINAHSHIYSALARGLGIKGHNPTGFVEVLEGMWWRIDRILDVPMTRLSAYATYIDCIKQGVTTLFDHHASYGEIPGSLFAIADVAAEVGVRTCLCYEVSDRDGEQRRDEGIRENSEFIEYATKKNDDRIKAMFGLHAAFTLSDKTLEKCVRVNDSRAGFHIHVAEGMADVYDSLQNYGTRTVNRLHGMGILGPKTILGHCIHVNHTEMDIIKETSSMIVNNPESNMGNAVGCSPVLEFFKKGILVGLGTDAYTNDMLESVKVALAIQRHNVCLPNVGFGEATSMLFSNNAKIAARFFDQPLGVIRPGAAADIIVLDYKPFTPFSGDNVDGHMLFGMTGRQCTTTMINGKLVMKDRELVGIDEEQINARILEGAKKLWAAING